MATIVHRAFLHRLTENDYLEGIRELIDSGEIANAPHSGTGKVIVGVFRALHEAMREVDPSIPTDLPPHCLDPEVVAKFFFGIPVEETNRQEKIDPEPLKVAVDSPYLTAEEGAAYLRTTVNGIYSLVKRGKLHPMPGRRTLLFTRESLDKCVTTRRRRR